MSELTDDQVLQALRDAGAILSGHFVLTSGRHSDTYVQCARVLEDPALTTRLAQEAVRRLDDTRVDLVAAPAVGGIIIGFALAQALGVRFIFSERQEGIMMFRRSFAIEPGDRVLVVEDVVTTGGSVAEVIRLVEDAGGVVAGVVSLIDRGGEKAFDETNFHPLLKLDAASWPADECDLCARGVEVYSPGSRRLGS